MTAPTRRISGLLAVMMLVSACAGQDADATTNSPQPQPPSFGCADPAVGDAAAVGATLTADLTDSAAGSVVRYSVTNAGTAPVYLVTLVADPPFVDRYRPDNYYLTAGTDGVIEISKREYWPPETCRLPLLYAPPPPALVIRLEPQQSFGETFVVSEPVQTRHPYDAFAIAQLPPIPSELTGIRFCLGVGSTARPVTGSEFPKDRDYYRLTPGDQKFLCSDVFPG